MNTKPEYTDPRDQQIAEETADALWRANHMPEIYDQILDIARLSDVSLDLMLDICHAAEAAQTSPELVKEMDRLESDVIEAVGYHRPDLAAHMRTNPVQALRCLGYACVRAVIDEAQRALSVPPPAPDPDIYNAGCIY